MLINWTKFANYIVYLFAVFCTSVSAKTPTKNSISFVTEHLPPFQIAHHSEVKGFATEVLQAAIAHTNINATYTAYSWSRAYNLAQQRANTCIYSIARTPQREKLFHWIDVITQTNSHFIGLSHRSDITLNKLEDAKQYQVAVLKDDVTHQLLLKKGFKEYHNLYVVNNTKSLLKLLTMRTNIDLIVADNISIAYRALYDDISPSLFAVYLKVNDAPLDFYLACNLETHNGLLLAMKAGFDAIKQSGQFQEITSRWQKEVPSTKDKTR